MSELGETLRRLSQRHVVRWAAAYIAGAWVLLQVAELLAGIFLWPLQWLRVLTVALVFGFLVAITLAWFHGEKGRQQFLLGEALILAAIVCTALVTMSLLDTGGSKSIANPFAGKGNTRGTADPAFDSGPSWAPDSASFVFASDQDGNSDLFIRQRNGSISRLTEDPGEDTQPAWSPDGHTILFASSRARGDKLDRSSFYGYSYNGDIWAVPAFGGTPRRLIEDGYNPAWSPDGKRFAFDASRNGPRRIWTASSDGDEIKVLTTGDSDQALHLRAAWSPDGKWLAYERQSGPQASSASIHVVSVDGAQEFAVTGEAHRNMAPAWAGNGSLVFASDRGGALNLWLVGIDLKSRTAAGEDFDPAVAPDGTLAYVSIRRLQNLWETTVDPQTLEFSGEPERIMAASWNDYVPSVSPDGRRIAFSSDRDGKYDIWLLDRETGVLTQLTDREGQDLQAVWSPDGSKIALYSNQNGKDDIWIVPVGGGPPVVITPPDSNDINPYWSPDGTRIGFTSDRSGRSEIWTMAIDGSDAKRLTDIGTLGHTARWSPDGRWLLFTSISAGDRDVWAVSADGGELRRLTTAPTQDAHGLWSADGATVLYLSDHQKVYARPFDNDEHRLLFDLGETIDYTHLSTDGKTFVFTREKFESDIWLIE